MSLFVLDNARTADRRMVLVLEVMLVLQIVSRKRSKAAGDTSSQNVLSFVSEPFCFEQCPYRRP